MEWGPSTPQYWAALEQGYWYQIPFETIGDFFCNNRLIHLLIYTDTNLTNFWNINLTDTHTDFQIWMSYRYWISEKYRYTDTVTDYTNYQYSPITVQLNLHVKEVPIIWLKFEFYQWWNSLYACNSYIKSGSLYGSSQKTKKKKTPWCMYTSMQLYKYACMQVCIYASMQVWKHLCMHVCKYESMHVFK